MNKNCNFNTYRTVLIIFYKTAGVVFMQKPIFTQKKATTVSGLFLHPNGLFCVYYLGVYMCSGL